MSRLYPVSQIILALVISTSVSSAQSWVEKRDNGASLNEIEAAFQQEWEGKEYTKGKGYKQYHRWYNFWQPRLYPHGSFDDIQSKYFDEYKDAFTYKKSNSNQKAAGNWESLGLAEWENNSYGPGNGRVNCIVEDPNNSDVIFLGTPSGGLWKSSDAGSSWAPLSDYLPSLGVSGIAIDPSDSDIIYISTGDNDNSDTYSIGVLKSTDGGLSWNTSGLVWDVQDNKRANKILINPEAPATLLCATNDGLYKTSNAGLTWNEVLGGNVSDIEFKPGNSSVVYASKTRLYKSNDTGDSFDEITTSPLPSSSEIGRLSIAVTEANAEVVYLLFADDVYWGFHGLYYSNDSGSSWNLRSNSPNILAGDDDGSALGAQAWYDMEIAVSNEDENQIIVGGINLWESSNGGSSWNLNSYWYIPNSLNANYVHADIHHLSYIDNRLYCGTDGGIYYSEDDGDGFSNLSSGLEISQFYRIGVSESASDFLLGGSQDNGTNRLASDVWTHVLGADGMECIIHPSDPDIMYAATQGGTINKSTDGGDTFEWSSSGITEDGVWVTPYILSPINPDIMLAGYENVWRSTDAGDSWAPISDFISQELVAVAMGTMQPNTMYAASQSKLFRTINGGAEWDDVSFGLPNLAITYMSVDPQDANRVWVVFSGFEEGEKVYTTADGGDNWENMSLNLPNVPVNCIVYNNETDDGTYIGTDLGVWYKDENLAHWEEFMDGLPNVIVNELEIHYGESKLLAATYGRGIWRSDLWQAPITSPEAAFSHFPIYICEGEDVLFTDESTLNAPVWNWTFEGGSPGISDDEQPLVNYSSAGEFDVTFNTENSEGTSETSCDGCVVVYANSGAQLPFFEGFENITEPEESAWYLNEDNSGEQWKINSDVSYGGNQSLWIDNYSIDNEFEFEIWSKPFDLSDIPSGDDVHISLKYAYAQIDDYNEDRMRLYVSDDCGETWTLRKQWTISSGLVSSSDTELPFLPADNNDWNAEIVDIPETDYSSSVSFKFWFRSDNGNNIFIDNINIYAGDVGINEPAQNNFVLYPNPTSGIIFIDHFDKSIYPKDFTLLDVSGRILDIKIKDKLGKFCFDTNGLSKGVYFLKIDTHVETFVVE